MMTAPIDVTFHGAAWLADDGLRESPLGISGGRIARGNRAIDLSGKLILPGIVDLHGDGFERHIAPRRGALTDARQGIVATEAELAANGISTAVLAQFYSWEGGLRGPDAARRMLAAVELARPTLATDLRVQLRIETHMLDALDDILSLIREHDIGYVAFNDHLPHKHLDAGKKPPRLVGTALKSGRSPETHLALMQSLHARSSEVPAAMAGFCQVLGAAGVRMASHDDHTAEDRRTWSSRGASISEFPETQSAAREARNAGTPTIMGAPNVVRGASHNGNASARELISEGLCTALASDYHYPAPRSAVWHLVDSGTLDLPQAWALISASPAAILGLQDRGTIAPGLRADLTILDANTRRVEATLSGGVITYLSGDTAARFVTAGA